MKKKRTAVRGSRYKDANIGRRSYLRLTVHRDVPTSTCTQKGAKEPDTLQ
jgi:hypothetical protein